jgi:hypothetical protein
MRKEEARPFSLETKPLSSLHVTCMCAVSLTDRSIGIAAYTTNEFRRDATMRAEFLY